MIGVTSNSPSENVGSIVKMQNSPVDEVQKRTMSLSWKSYVSTMAGSGAVLIPRMNCEEGSSVWALCIITNRSSTAVPVLQFLRLSYVCDLLFTTRQLTRTSSFDHTTNFTRNTFNCFFRTLLQALLLDQITGTWPCQEGRFSLELPWLESRGTNDGGNR